MQKLMDSLLDKNYEKRPSIEDIIKIINKNLTMSFMEKIMEIFQEDESYQNYIIERDVLNSIDQVQETIIAREKKFNDIKYYAGIILIGKYNCWNFNRRDINNCQFCYWPCSWSRSRTNNDINNRS